MSLEVLFLIFIALLVGAAGPIQAGVNATIAQYNGHPLTAAFTNTMVASAFLFILMLVARVPVPQMSSLAQAPWWAWTGGLFGPAAAQTTYWSYQLGDWFRERRKG